MKDLNLIKPTASLLEASKTILLSKSRCIIIIDNEKVLGVFSEGDLLRAILKGIDLYSPVKPLVNINFHYLHGLDYEKAWSIFKSTGITLLPIITKSFDLIDTITLQDMMNNNVVLIKC